MFCHFLFAYVEPEHTRQVQLSATYGNSQDIHTFTDLAPVAQNLDKAIHCWINLNLVDSTIGSRP